MRLNKLIAISMGMVCLAHLAVAQLGYHNDALLFSQTQFNGSARLQAVGGAQVALGGDISSATSNPAGLGFYNRSVFSFTPALDFHNSESDFLGSGSSTFKNNFNFNQLGAAFYYGKGDVDPDKFKGGTLAISLNRLNNFNGQISYDGRNNQNSITDSFIQQAQNFEPNALPGLSNVAYEHFLIEEADYDSTPDFFINDVNGQGVISPNFSGDIDGYASLVGSFEGYTPRQIESIETKGGQYQFNVAYGGNYDDMIYFGGAVGIQSISYTQKRNYAESEFQDADGNPDNILNSISISDRLFVDGSGVNVTLGAIFRPLNFFTLGVSYVSPTYYALSEESDFEFTTDWNSNFSYVAGADTIQLSSITTTSDIFTTNYNIKSPSKLNLGTAFFLGKYGFVSADLEYVDYSTAKLRSGDFVVTEDNQEIESAYQNAINVRLGAEARIGKVRARAGGAYFSDPYSDGDEIDRSSTRFTFGLGYRERDYFVDLAIINTFSNSVRSPYNLVENTPEVISDLTTTTAAITVGLVF